MSPLKILRHAYAGLSILFFLFFFYYYDIRRRSLLPYMRLCDVEKVESVVVVEEDEEEDAGEILYVNTTMINQSR